MQRAIFQGGDINRLAAAGSSQRGYFRYGGRTLYPVARSGLDNNANPLRLAPSTTGLAAFSAIRPADSPTQITIPVPPRIHSLLLIVAFATIYIGWGTTYLANHFLLLEVPPFVIGSLRFSIAGLLELAWVVLSGQLHIQRSD